MQLRKIVNSAIQQALIWCDKLPVNFNGKIARNSQKMEGKLEWIDQQIPRTKSTFGFWVSCKLWSRQIMVISRRKMYDGKEVHLENFVSKNGAKSTNEIGLSNSDFEELFSFNSSRYDGDIFENHKRMGVSCFNFRILGTYFFKEREQFCVVKLTNLS